jgi:hypothetical protein
MKSVDIDAAYLRKWITAAPASIQIGRFLFGKAAEFNIGLQSEALKV